jgi:hypothetical protein
LLPPRASSVFVFVCGQKGVLVWQREVAAGRVTRTGDGVLRSLG